MRLERTFFQRPCLEVAQDCLGKVLVFRSMAGVISECEAYGGDGVDDPACHAARGMTPRNRPMFGVAGRSYVYFIYGMYHCLNVVVEAEGVAAAVLIRGLIPLRGCGQMQSNRGKVKERDIANGPGKLCQALGITKEQNDLDLCENDEFCLSDEGFVPRHIERSERIGISSGQELLWRFSASEFTPPLAGRKS